MKPYKHIDKMVKLLNVLVNTTGGNTSERTTRKRDKFAFYCITHINIIFIHLFVASIHTIHVF